MDDQLEEFSLDRRSVGVPEDSVYSPTADQESAFVEDIIGEEVEKGSEPTEVASAQEVASTPTNSEWPVFNYETKGGKKIAVKHDKWGSFWHVEFVPGGQLPNSLNGRFTTEQDARFATEQYLAKQD